MNRTSLVAALTLALALAAPVALAQEAGKQETAKPDIAKPDLAKAKQTVETICAACHGADGNSAVAGNPNLAGQGAEYISRQLQHFKAGIRANPIMQGMAMPLSDADMVALGLYFSQQKPKNGTAKDAKLVAAAQKIYRAGDPATGLPACAACHSPNGAGIPRNYPRIAGQHPEYALAQLKAFRAGERGNDKDGKDLQGKIMASIAARMNDTQMQALSDYVSGLR